MRRFANLYLALYLIDAGCSLIDELIGPSLFSGLRYTVALVTLALTLPLYVSLGIDRRLPKMVFVPLVLFLVWSSLALWPLSSVIGRAQLGLSAAGGQLLLGLLGVAVLRLTDGDLGLAQNRFRAAYFSLANTVTFVVISLLLLPLALLYAGVATTGDYLEEKTAGFLQLRPVGIYMADQTYRREDKIIRLAGMIHVGRDDYYQDLAASVPTARTIILAEGVTDHDRLLQHHLDYNRVAGLLGLSSQQTLAFDANLVDLDTPAGPVEPGPDRNGPGGADIAYADIDIRDFSPETIEFLNVLGTALDGDRPLSQGLREYNAWVEQHLSAERMSGIFADILTKRNDQVIDRMAKSLDRYDTILIPWGAMHMPAIEQAVLDRGFVPAERHERLSLDFRTIPYARLWQKLSGSGALTH